MFYPNVESFMVRLSQHFGASMVPSPNLEPVINLSLEHTKRSLKNPQIPDVIHILTAKSNNESHRCTWPTCPSKTMLTFPVVEFLDPIFTKSILHCCNTSHKLSYSYIKCSR